MELLKKVNKSYVKGLQYKQRLKLLAAFLDDAQKVVPEPGSLSIPPSIRESVQNVAASEIANILDMPRADPNYDWTAKQWEEFRHQVRERLKK